MGGKGGSSIDTSGLERATDRATQMLREQYETTRADMQPWYQMGTAATGRLSDLLGLTGGTMQTREQIYDELLPQYTTTTTTPAQYGNLVVTPDGTVIDVSDVGAVDRYYAGVGADEDAGFKKQRLRDAIARDDFSALEGFQRMGAPATTQEVIDREALNAAVTAQMAGQETPEDYGSLLTAFGAEQFEEDPGYQFRKEEAQKALERRMAAQGVTLGGAGFGEVNPQVARALEEQAQGLASQEYQQAYNRYVNDQLNTYNMLMGASGTGLGATTTLAQAGQQMAGQTAGLTTDLASAQMQAQMAEAAQPSMFDSLLGTGLQLGAAYLTGGGSLAAGGLGGAGGMALPIGVGGTSYLL